MAIHDYMREYPCGDISLYYKGVWYEYDGFTNRYYYLDDGTTVNSPDGKLAKRRISKKLFEDIVQEIQSKEDVK